MATSFDCVHLFHSQRFCIPLREDAWKKKEVLSLLGSQGRNKGFFSCNLHQFCLVKKNVSLAWLCWHLSYKWYLSVLFDLAGICWLLLWLFVGVVLLVSLVRMVPFMVDLCWLIKLTCDFSLSTWKGKGLHDFEFMSLC